jgi:hypothetical protein
MESLMLVEKFLLETVWGILILGACGSIIGGSIIYLLKGLYRKISSNRELYLKRFLYKYYIESVISEKLMETIKPSKDIKYAFFANWELAELIIEVIALFLVLFFIAIVAMLYGVERPYVLSMSISLAFIFAHNCLKNAFSSFGFLDSEIFQLQKSIGRTQPKNYDEWEESIKDEDVYRDRDGHR